LRRYYFKLPALKEKTMSMEDILKVLIDSRQTGGGSRPSAGQDPMTALIGRLLGGQQPGGSQGVGLGDMMGVLESIMASSAGSSMGSGQAYGQQAQMPGLGQGLGAGNPIMSLLQPMVNQLAKKANISPEIAMLVVSFVVQKLLAHHPTSGRDSTQFDLDDMLQQLSSGEISQQTLQSSGLVNELARNTGLDQDTAARSLNAAFGLVGSQVKGSAGKAQPKKSGRSPAVRGAAGKKGVRPKSRR
jgi:hypothetical protein